MRLLEALLYSLITLGLLIVAIVIISIIAVFVEAFIGAFYGLSLFALAILLTLWWYFHKLIRKTE